MSICVREAMIALAGRPPMHGEQHRWLCQIAKTAGISYRTARSLWLGEIDDPDHIAAREVRRAAEVKKVRQEAVELSSTFKLAAENMRAAHHSNLSSAEIDLVERVARLLGCLR